MVTVREATQQDAEAIAHVHIESWRTTYDGIVPDESLASLDERERALQWKEWLTLDIQSFVALEAGEIVGFASGGPIREPIDSYDAELFAIYLLKQAQGRGTGTALLKAVAAALESSNYKSMVAWVLQSNASTHFYEKTGALANISKQIEIGGVMVPVIAYGWPALKAIGTYNPGVEYRSEPGREYQQPLPANSSSGMKSIPPATRLVIFPAVARQPSAIIKRLWRFETRLTSSSPTLAANTAMRLT